MGHTRESPDTKKALSEVWSTEQALSVWDDLEYLGRVGYWRDGIPKWAQDLAAALGAGSTAGSAAVLMCAYERCCRALVAEVRGR